MKINNIVACRNRPSFPVVYTTNGTRVAAAYSGMCTECESTIQHSSWIPRNDEKQEYFFDPLHSACDITNCA